MTGRRRPGWWVPGRIYRWDSGADCVVPSRLELKDPPVRRVCVKTSLEGKTNWSLVQQLRRAYEGVKKNTHRRDAEDAENTQRRRGCIHTLQKDQDQRRFRTVSPTGGVGESGKSSIFAGSSFCENKVIS